jgi:hypothetical protein
MVHPFERPLPWLQEHLKPELVINLIHRPIIERQLAIEGKTAKKPEVIQAEIEELLQKYQE